MSKKLIGWIGIIAGALLVLISLGADLVGIGTYPGIHTAQIVGAVAGLVVLALGLITALKNKN